MLWKASQEAFVLSAFVMVFLLEGLFSSEATDNLCSEYEFVDRNVVQKGTISKNPSILFNPSKNAKK